MSSKIQSPFNQFVQTYRDRILLGVTCAVLMGTSCEKSKPGVPAAPPIKKVIIVPVDNRLTSTAPIPVLHVTEAAVIAAVNKPKAALPFEFAEKGLYKAAKLPVDLYFHVNQAGDVEYFSFTVRMADFVELATVNRRVDQSKVNEQIALLATAIDAASDVVDKGLDWRKEDLPGDIRRCMDGAATAEIRNGTTTAIQVSRKLLGAATTVSIDFRPM